MAEFILKTGDLIRTTTLAKTKRAKQRITNTAKMYTKHLLRFLVLFLWFMFWLNSWGVGYMGILRIIDGSTGFVSRVFDG